MCASRLPEIYAQTGQTVLSTGEETKIDNESYMIEIPPGLLCRSHLMELDESSATTDAKNPTSSTITPNQPTATQEQFS